MDDGFGDADERSRISRRERVRRSGCGASGFRCVASCVRQVEAPDVTRDSSIQPRPSRRIERLGSHRCFPGNVRPWARVNCPNAWTVLFPAGVFAAIDVFQRICPRGSASSRCLRDRGISDPVAAQAGRRGPIPKNKQAGISRPVCIASMSRATIDQPASPIDRRCARLNPGRASPWHRPSPPAWPATPAPQRPRPRPASRSSCLRSAA